MLIIDSRHDYYDSATTIVDKSIVYQRTKKELQIKVKSNFPYLKRSYAIAPFVIGFCGKLYYGFEDSIEKKIMYNIESLYQHLENQKYDMDKFNRNEQDFWGIQFSKKNCEKFFNAEIPFPELEELFLKHKVPIFYWTNLKLDHNCILNPILKDYNFQKVIDPYTAMQEIQMYVSNDLVETQDKMAKVSDKSKIVKAGFDLKTSFRNTK